MKINKIENRITYFMISLAIFLLNINKISLLNIVFGSLLALLLILFCEKTNLYKFKITKFILFIISIIFMITTLNTITYFIGNNILREYSTIIISFTLLLSIFILGNKGYHTIIKVIILASYFIIFLAILGFLLTIPYIDLTNLNIKSIETNHLVSGSLYFGFLLTYVYFLIYKITNTKFQIRDLMISSIYQIINYLLVISILGITLTRLYQYPYITIFKKVNLFNFIERIEIIFSLNYLFIFYFLLLLSYYQIRYILENYMKKDKKQNLFLIFITVLIFIFSLMIF